MYTCVPFTVASINLVFAFIFFSYTVDSFVALSSRTPHPSSSHGPTSVLSGWVQEKGNWVKAWGKVRKQRESLGNVT